MRHIFVSIIFLSLSLSLFSQKVADNAYWFYFTDKQENSYSIDQPGAFLSQRSIDRRAWQSLPVNETDLPVSQAYLDSLETLGLEIKHVSKWLNGALVLSQDSLLIDSLYQFSFIDSTRWQADFENAYFPDLPSQDRFEPAYKIPPSYAYGYSQQQIDQIRVNYLHQKGYTGNGVHISVMDVGFSSMPELPSFEELYNDGRVLATKDFIDGTADVYKSHTHGTNVSSLIVAEWPDSLMGTAPDATLILANTEDGASETKIEEFAWIEAAEWADSLGTDIINTSLGYTEFDNEATNYSYKDMDGTTAFISMASAMTAEKGIVCVTSAGNSGNDPWYYIGTPGDARNILTVGAIDKLGNIANFSSRGPTYDRRIKPEIVAMGVQAALQSSNGSPALGNGTSFSSPLIAGAVASLWQAYPSMTATDLMQSIIESGDRKKTPDSIYGYGVPDFGATFHAITNAPNSIISEQLKAYPNPFKDYFNIELPLNLSGEFQIAIYDIQGRIIYSSLETVPARISTGTISSGMFIIEVKNRDYSYRSRIIKY